MNKAQNRNPVLHTNLARRWAALSFNKSDPHCYARTKLHLDQGLLDTDDFRHDLEAKEAAQ